MASLDLDVATAKPGQRVTFRGAYYNDAHPVMIRLDSVQGPVLATVAPDALVDFGHSFWREITGSFVVPAEATPGSHIVLATQEDAQGKPTWGVPARAPIEVVGADGAIVAQPTPAEMDEVTRLNQLRVQGAQEKVVLLFLLGGAGAVVGAMATAGLCRRRQAPGATSP